MPRNVSLALGAVALMAAPSGAAAESVGLSLRAVVPVHCTVRHRATGYGASLEGAVSLGQLREFCNAAAGYRLVVNYTPGSLRGAVLTVGDDRIVLNGSGQAVVSQAPGPRVRERALAAIPGERGFDTQQLQFQVQPI